MQVGSLYTTLTLESSSFLTNTKRAATATEQMANTMNKQFALAKGAAVGFIASLGVSEVLRVTNAGLAYASSLGETAQQLGVSTRALQEYTFAATQTGIEQSTLETGLAKLTRTLGEAQAGGKKQAEAFAAVGVSYAELQRLTPDEAFRRVAQGLGAISDPAKRAAIEVDLFGKAGQKLDTLLSGGIGQIDQLSRAANELGVVLSDEQIQNADNTADKISALKMVLSANIASVVADNADGILTLANAIATLAGAAGKGLGDIRDFFVGIKDIAKNDGVLATLKALTFDDAAMERGRNVAIRRDIMGGNLRANGLPGFDRQQGVARIDAMPVAAAKVSAGKKAATDIYANLTSSEIRMGFKDTLTDVLGTGGEVSQGMQDALEISLDLGDALKTVGIAAANIPPINPITSAAIDAAQSFGENLSRNLGQAIVFGQSLGDALVSSIKAAAAELITSGLLDLLTGKKGGGGSGLLGDIISGAAAIFGGGKAGGGMVKAGYSYDVGELGRERFVAPADGQIVPNNMLTGMGSGPIINVDARGATDPAMIEAAGRRGAEQGIAAAAQMYARSSRQPIPRGRI
jgi:hypothetical protein